MKRLTDEQAKKHLAKFDIEQLKRMLAATEKYLPMATGRFKVAAEEDIVRIKAAIDTKRGA